MNRKFRLISVFLTVFLIVSQSTLIFADIPENNGLGTPLQINGIVKNISATANSTGTNKNWLDTRAASFTDTIFDSGFRITSKGTDAPPSTNQVRITFNSPAMAAGDYVYVSFYYRALSECDGTSYASKPVSFACTSLNTSSGLKPASGGTTYQNAEEFDKWYKVSYTYPLTADVAEGVRYLQMSFSKPKDALPAYCMEVADVNILYFGNVTGQSSELIQKEISDTLKSAEFSSLTVDDENIDLNLYPNLYAKKVLWDGVKFTAVAAKDMYGRDADVQCSNNGLPTDVTVTIYSYDYDYTAPDESLKKVYTVKLDYIRAQAVTLVGTKEISSLDGCTGGETAVIRPTFYNPNGETQTYVVILGIVKDNKFVAAIPWTYTTDENKTSETCDFCYVLPEGDYEGARLRGFIISPLKAVIIN